MITCFEKTPPLAVNQVAFVIFEPMYSMKQSINRKLGPFELEILHSEDDKNLKLDWLKEETLNVNFFTCHIWTFINTQIDDNFILQVKVIFYFSFSNCAYLPCSGQIC